MSLRRAEIAPVPAATAQVAAAAFPKGCPAMRLRDELGAVYDDRMFASLYPARGQPAHSPWRLALVTVLQFTEGLSDRQAADAVRGRIDWKYITRHLRLPSRITLLPYDRCERVVLEEPGVAIHGQSFARPAVTEDLSANYPAPIPGLFNIGLLHTSLNGRLGVLPQRRMLPSKPPLPHRDAPVASCSR